MTDGPIPSEWSSRQVRDRLADLLRRDLLGPWEGDTEIIEGKVGPRDRYLTGILAPLDAGSEDPGADEDLDAGEFGDESDDRPAAGVAATRLFPSSMGLTCAVAAGTASLTVTVTWGRYERVAPDTLEAPDDPGSAGDQGGQDGAEGSGLVVNESPSKRKSRPWRRLPITGSVTIPLTGSVQDTVVDETRLAPHEAPSVWLRWIVRPDDDGRRVVTVFLVNRQTRSEFEKSGVDASWMYQCRMVIEDPEGGAPFTPTHSRAGFASADEDREQAMLAMLYRGSPEYASGHGVAVGWEEPAQVDAADRRAVRVWTEALPFHDVPQTQAPTAAEIPGFADLVLDMSALAGADSGATAAAMLRPMVTSYREWIAAAGRRAESAPDLAPFRSVAGDNLDRALRAADRIDAGLDLLARDRDVWTAFRFMNESMALQRRHTEAISLRKASPDLSWKAALAQVDVPAKRSWRPFQIAFVLLNLPALADPLNPERVAGGPGQPPADSALADLLFFPTGGGKTEAYLGLTAFTFAMRRLQGVVAGRDGSRGVAVLMRYTLRLLTSQQLQRAATLVAATEVIRRKAMAAGVNRWGDEPFRIGLWVGGSVTPNRFEAAVDYVDAARGHGRKGAHANTSPVPFNECPWCGSEISAKRDVYPDTATRRVHIYCGDTTGACAFTKARNADGLPVLTVDEEIYRFPPSLLIGTVDKFAQLPRNGASGHLFGLVSQECTRHGFKHADIRAQICDANKHLGKGNLAPAETRPVQRLRPVDLIIQDELHLIADALGTMVGLYETAVDELATWTVDGHRVRPKVVASTATVRRASEQAYALFRRQLAVFPPPGLEVEDSFFARQVPVNEDHPGRRYLGVCAQGIRLKSVEIRVTSAVMTFAQALFDAHGMAADPYMTLVGYFNALRELGGMRRLVEDDIAARLRRPLHPGLPRRRNPAQFTAELTSRVSSRAIKETLAGIDVAFDPQYDTTVVREQAQASGPKGRKKTTAARRSGAGAGAGKAIAKAVDPARPMPKDVVLATSMFGVGVDISRLGLMTVTGQPKATSEYIQATSRVGRDPRRPGLVITLYNWARPRDLSHYERFGHYHETFYQQVEALSVTPFSIPALNRALTGAFLGALRHLVPDYNPDTGIHQITAQSPQVRELVELFAQRAAAITGRADVGVEVRSLLEKRLADLAKRRENTQGQTTLTYLSNKGDLVRVLRDPESGVGWGPWTVPNSLRETEPEINLQVIPTDPSLEDPHYSIPPWRPRAAAPQGTDGE